MKKILIVALMIYSSASYCIAPPDSIKIQFNQTQLALIKAQNFADPQSLQYKPQAAFDIYSKLAMQGNVVAMNGLAMLYSKGIGTPVDDLAAVSLFEKAANKGYLRAWYNLGIIYKDGLGVTQDFAKAYETFKRGADKNDAFCEYMQGYMLYKGFGCIQSYEQAVALFTKSKMRCIGSMYMLGLSYRNGYGVTINLDSARYWLAKASGFGYVHATDELASPTPENISSVQIAESQGPSTQKAVFSKGETGYKKTKHHLPANSISGNYTGYAVKFDYSGKHIISQSALRVHLNNKNQIVTGEWAEDGAIATQFEAVLTDSALLFSNTHYIRPDHYNNTSQNEFEFKNANLQLVKSADSVIISGNLQLYSNRLKEPEKPMFVMLIRDDKKEPSGFRSDSLTNKTNVASNKSDSVKFVIYPNPFFGVLNANFILKKANTVRLMISRLTDARIVYRGPAQEMMAGEHTISLQIDGLPGTYICTLSYGNQVKSAIVFKQ